MQAKPQGPLEDYNSLTDENLAGYFSCPRRRRYLRKMGLITKDGLILDEETIRLYHSHKEHRQKSNRMIAEGLVKRAIENDRKRRGVLKKKMDELLKLENAEKIKARHPTGVATINPTEASSLMLSSTLQLHHDHLQLTSSQFDDITQLICEMKASNTIASQYVNPYTCTVRVRPPSAPRPMNSTNAQIRQTRLKRPKTAPVGVVGDQKPIKDKIHTNIEMTLRFLGGNISLRGTVAQTHLIEVHQQHCGGSTIPLYKGYLLPQDTFSFVSRRHHEMPFGLSLYIDGIIDCRVSTCCEYKHQCGKCIGGKSAHFQLIGIDGGKPCYRCTVMAKQCCVQELPTSKKSPQVTNIAPQAAKKKDQEKSYQDEDHYQADFENETGNEETENEAYGSDFESSQDPHKAGSGGKDSGHSTSATSSRSSLSVSDTVIDTKECEKNKSKSSSSSSNGGSEPPTPIKESDNASGIQLVKPVDVNSSEATNNNSSTGYRQEEKVTIAVVTDESYDNSQTKVYKKIDIDDDKAMRKYLEQIITNAKNTLEAEAPHINIIPPSPRSSHVFADDVNRASEVRTKADSTSDSPQSDGGRTASSDIEKESEVSLGLSISDGTTSTSPTEFSDRDGRSNRLNERSIEKCGSVQEIKKDSLEKPDSTPTQFASISSPTLLVDDEKEDNRTLSPKNDP